MANATAIAERHATRTPVACCRETLPRALLHSAPLRLKTLGIYEMLY
ncbi:MAG: hypothetical protein KME57_35310 [Scytonema hyalinum WJT4-NPBG1]|nr:hypothetical protein [Scytonema hyalinum WJT4-NPBG1]